MGWCGSFPSGRPEFLALQWGACFILRGWKAGLAERGGKSQKGGDFGAKRGGFWEASNGQIVEGLYSELKDYAAKLKDYTVKLKDYAGAESESNC